MRNFNDSNNLCNYSRGRGELHSGRVRAAHFSRKMRVKNPVSGELLAGLDRILGMTTKRPTTKSPVTLAREALAVAQESLPAYSSKFSRHDYTQHQHFALLALREFLKTDYRGL